MQARSDDPNIYRLLLYRLSYAPPHEPTVVYRTSGELSPEGFPLDTHLGNAVFEEGRWALLRTHDDFIELPHWETKPPAS